MSLLDIVVPVVVAFILIDVVVVVFVLLWFLVLLPWYCIAYNVFAQFLLPQAKCGLEEVVEVSQSIVQMFTGIKIWQISISIITIILIINMTITILSIVIVVIKILGQDWIRLEEAKADWTGVYSVGKHGTAETLKY